MADVADHVTQDPETGLYTFICPGDPMDPCGSPGQHTFFSAGWADKEHAVARGTQHIDSHVNKTVMQSVEDYKAAVGLAEPVGLAPVQDLSVYLNPDQEV